MGSAADFVIKNSKLKKYKGSGGAVVIPDGVTSIGNWAFEGCTSLTGITIPNSVTSIGGYAFKGCTGLTGIEIPSSVISIGWSAFEGCTGLADIKITSRITSIGEHAFEGCPGLSSIKIPDSEAEIEEPAFEDLTGLTDIKKPHNTSNAADFVISNGVLIQYEGSGGVVVIPDGVTSIGLNAFRNSTSVTSITIPNSVTHIGERAFKGCTGLTSVIVESGNPVYHSDGNCIIKTSTKVLVAGCQSSIIPTDGSVISIGTGAFDGCTGLTSIKIPNSVTSIGERAFEGCTGLTGIEIPNSVTSIGDCAFAGCIGLAGTKLPSRMGSVWGFSIKDGELKKYKGSDSVVVIPDGVTSIGWDAFRKNTRVTSIEIPNSVTSIDMKAFEGCTGLTSITIPDSVIAISTDAFRRCTRLTNITIPDSVTSIGDRAFDGCKGLTSLTIPNSVTSIGWRAFDGCTGLTNIKIPNSVTSIGGEAFKDCTGLTDITIPDSVTSIGNGAFSGCTGLTKIEIPKSVTRIGERAFSGCTGLTKIEIPKSVTSIGSSAFEGCTGLTSVEIPNSVRYIGGCAFVGCDNLKELSIANLKCKFAGSVFGEALPKGLLGKLDMSGFELNASDSLKYNWSNMTANMQAKTFLMHQGKDLLTFYAYHLPNIEELGNALLEVLPQKPSVKECGAVAGYMTMHYEDVPTDLLHRMHERLKPLKSAEKALKTIEANLELMTKLQPKTLSPLEQRMMEILQKQGLSGNAQDVMLKEYYGITLSVLPKVQCKDGSTAPASALGWLLTAHEKHYEPEEYKGTIKEGRKEVCVAYTKPGLCPEAEEILAELDSASFQDFLHKLVQNTLKGVERGKKLYLAYPISRYADEERMAELVKITSYSRKKALVKILECASLYSNTHAAMLFADKRGCLRVYAKLRRTTEDDLRDTILSDVGIDENGAKTYDLGNQIVTARMQADLSFLIELPDGKTAKSLPKKGADAEKYAAANTDFSNMKKNVKKIAKNRKDILFEEFFSGKSRSAQSWCDTYLNNPVLKSVASLLVWHQRNLTFTLKNGQPVDSTGQPYQIRPSTPITLAHPMEMNPEVVRAWQMYFVSNGVKQPFIQIWEPVIDPTTIRRDRYKGLKIPGYRLMSQDKHGITVKYDWGGHKMLYYFSGCDVSIQRLVEPPLYLTWNRFGDKVVDYSNQGVDPQEFFEIWDFAFRKYTRQVNHIVGLLDKGTLYDLIVKDDTTIVDRLSSFTLAQIEEFLKLAMDNNCMNVTAALLEFKNANFAGFDPMAEFTLDF